MTYIATQQILKKYDGNNDKSILGHALLEAEINKILMI